MKARHRCEVFFIARIMQVIAIKGVRFDTQEEHENFMKIALEAVLEPLDGLDVKSREAICRRVQRMEDLTLQPACEKSFAERIILIGYHFINNLLERDYLEITDDSKLRRVTDALLSMIDMDDDIAQTRYTKTKKEAARWMKTLQSMGYYPD